MPIAIWLLSLITVYTAGSKTMKDESKIFLYVAVGIISVIYILFAIIL